MNIYKVSQDDNIGYDTFDSFVCYAPSEENARQMMPSDITRWGDYEWVDQPSQVKVQLIGYTNEIVASEVIVSSFNAG